MCDVIDSKTFLHFQFIFFLSQLYKGFYKVVATCCHTKSIEYKIQFENIKWGKDFFFAIRTIHFWYLAWIENRVFDKSNQNRHRRCAKYIVGINLLNTILCIYIFTIYMHRTYVFSFFVCLHHYHGCTDFYDCSKCVNNKSIMRYLHILVLVSVGKCRNYVQLERSQRCESELFFPIF